MLKEIVAGSLILGGVGAIIFIFRDKIFPPVSDEPTNAAIKALKDVWARRSDLQEVFPEVADGDFDRLMAWAIIFGTTTDTIDLEPSLVPFREEYIRILEEKGSSISFYDMEYLRI